MALHEQPVIDLAAAESAEQFAQDRFFAADHRADGALGKSRDDPRVAIIIAHEDLFGCAMSIGLVAQALGDDRLVSIEELIVLAARSDMHLVTDDLQHGDRLAQLTQIVVIELGDFLELLEVGRAAQGKHGPEHRMDVAQAARPFLEVWFKQKDRRLKPFATLPPLRVDRLEEPLAPPPAHAGRHDLVKALEKGFAAGQMASLNHRRGGFHVAPDRPLAIGNRARGVTQIQPQVDQQVQQGLGESLSIAIVVLFHQQQHVDIRAQEELSTPVAAQRHQGNRRGRSALLLFPGMNAMGIGGGDKLVMGTGKAGQGLPPTKAHVVLAQPLVKAGQEGLALLDEAGTRQLHAQVLFHLGRLVQGQWQDYIGHFTSPYFSILR